MLDDDDPPPPRWRRALAISLQVLLGLGLGAALGECAFNKRADGAFPHVNFYLPDPALGVRLEPGASMRFKLRDNPVSTIHVNADGYRGYDWTPPGKDDVLVVGDSQVFGLGVDDGATFSARLARRSGRAVINAGVPTYGPQEYLAVARELLPQRKPKTVVVALNYVNDPFELDRPNRERHAVWDGWAVRIETAPASVLEFPGRKWLFSRSHMVYALRRWLHARGTAGAPESVELGTPSEGNLQDLLVASQKAHADAILAQAHPQEGPAAARERLDRLAARIRGHEDSLVDLVHQHARRHGQPGDIVEAQLSESSRGVRLTAAMIRRIASARAEYLDALLRDRDAETVRHARSLLAEQDALVGEAQALRARIAAGIPPLPRPPSFFRAYLQDFKKLCDEHGAELVVVALPIDVQVHAREWLKYGVHDGPDMTESRILLTDLVADARDLGLRALDATDALAAVGPGAFLDHDIHMTAKGHAALADALAVTLTTPRFAVFGAPNIGLPPGHTFVPAAAEWTAPGEKVRGAPPGCTIQLQGGWLRVQCVRQSPRDSFNAVAVRTGATPATMAMRTVDGLSLVTPLTPGAPLTARFHRDAGTWDLAVRWPGGPAGQPALTATTIDVPAEPAPADPHTDAIAALCACHIERQYDLFCVEPRSSDADHYRACKPTCGRLWGDPALITACNAAFPDCTMRLACAQNDPLAAPTCPEGQVHAFASNACFTPCDADHPCAAGTRTPWHTGAVCT